MASSSNSCFQEGQCSTRPPLFCGTNYTQWKIRMRIHMRSQGYDLWKVVENGNFVPRDPVTLEMKREDDLTNEDKRKLSLNDKAIDILFCALDTTEFNRVSACESAKEIWDTLQVTHEGTSQVKESKINMLYRSYELFEMKSGENITDMYKRFSNIINDLKGLGKKFETFELVKKLLRSLPESWDTKVTAIEESKDLTKMQLDELIGSLLTYEIKRK